MTFNFPTTASVPEDVGKVMGKRFFYHLDMGVQQPLSNLRPSKRPRSTPGSVISAITEEENADLAGKVSPPPPYGVCTGAYVYDLEQIEHDPPTVVEILDEAEPIEVIDDSDDEVEEVVEEEAEEEDVLCKIRSDEDIQVDVDNSFTGTARSTVDWTSDLIIQVLANEVEDMIYANEEKIDSADVGEFQVFYSSYRQPFELDFYMRRLVQYVQCSRSVFVTMFAYLERIQKTCKPLLVSEMNCHRLVFTCLVLAVKFLEDEVHSNGYYSRVGGLTIEEMNNLEVKLLDVLDWNLNVCPDAYGKLEERLSQSASCLLAGDDVADTTNGYESSLSEE